eukprot:CAMPEP_0115015306 /NCGR_PEP_ID=MMETSP0216-20121206/26682_1 /TAXON_ID=223996 /ORGANISM="Protocruzia adherens, Strain Boccale" /LENGTH=475 /DNA_ID=CAMNT_0002385385 /DNA_START=2081 /DNA_END=3508 /DNA_ORIENTATION=-
MERFSKTLPAFMSGLIKKDEGQQDVVNPSSSWEGKRVIVTGATSGIGRSIAYWMLNEGACVGLVGRDKEELNKIGSQFPDQALSILCDLAVDRQQYDMATSVIEHFGGLDCLVNCAGVIFDGDVETTYPQDFDYLMDINLRAVFHLTQLCAPFLEKTRGCIVNVSCQLGTRPHSGFVSYCVTKAGIEMLTKCAALEFAEKGIRINAVCPSITQTNLFEAAGLTGSRLTEFMNESAEANPLCRVAAPEEVAKAVLFLCSERARNITGQILKVDGGRTLTMSGYQKWEGMTNANEAFERKSTVSSVGKWVFPKKEQKESTKTPGSDDWVDEIQSSNWATHYKDAHLKSNFSYAVMEGEDDVLAQYGGKSEKDINRRTHANQTESGKASKQSERAVHDAFAGRSGSPSRRSNATPDSARFSMGDGPRSSARKSSVTFKNKLSDDLNALDKLEALQRKSATNKKYEKAHSAEANYFLKP